MRRCVFFLFVFFSVAVAAEQIVVDVTAYNNATVSGDVPAGVEVQYMQYQTTHHKGRLLAGDSAVLTLSGMPLGRLQGVTLEMHSNMSGGAGSLRLYCAEAPVWQIDDDSFAAETWNGTYTNEFVEISKTFADYTPLSDIRVVITASVNSLYIRSFTFEYVAMSDQAYTVSFDTHCNERCRPRTEQEPGAGVVLPTLPDWSDEWLFRGWTEKWCPMTNVAPEYMPAGEIYYPSADITLHALYATKSSEKPVLRQVTQPVSGRYALGVVLYRKEGVVTYTCILTGGAPGPSHKLQTVQCNIEYDDEGYVLTGYDKVPEACIYILTFDEDSLTIKHEATGRVLGHNGKNLTNDSCRWAWQLTETGRVMVYYDYNAETNIASVFSVYPGNSIDDIDMQYGKVSNMYPSDMLGLILFPVECDTPTDVWYASEPVSNGVEQVQNDREYNSSDIGKVYDVSGRYIGEEHDYSTSAVPSVRIIRRQGCAEKVMR